MRRLALLALLPVAVIPGEPIAPRPTPNLADLFEQGYRRRPPAPDPLVLGRPLAFWRAAAKCHGITFGGWAGHAEFRHGPDPVVVYIQDPAADRVAHLFLALADDPDPGVRLVAARGLGGYHGSDPAVTTGALVALRWDTDPAVRWEAVRALLRFAWHLLGEDELRRVAGGISDGPPDPTYPFGVSPVRPAELAALGPRDRPAPWGLALAPEVGDADLAEVGRFRGLYALYARGTLVTDAGLPHLAGLPALRTLDLRRTGVTDAGLRHLIGLPNLGLVYVDQTAATDGGVAELRAARPDLDVRR